jgi:hypothetical protein
MLVLKVWKRRSLWRTRSSRVEQRASRERCGRRHGQAAERGVRSTRLCVVIDGLGSVQIAACGVLEAEGGAVEEGEALCAPRKDVVGDGVVELLGVLHDRDEGVLDRLLSLALVGGKCGAEPVDETGPVDRGEVVAGGMSAAR